MGWTGADGVDGCGWGLVGVDVSGKGLHGALGVESGPSRSVLERRGLVVGVGGRWGLIRALALCSGAEGAWWAMGVECDSVALNPYTISIRSIPNDIYIITYLFGPRGYRFLQRLVSLDDVAKHDLDASGM